MIIKKFYSSISQLPTWNDQFIRGINNMCFRSAFQVWSDFPVETTTCGKYNNISTKQQQQQKRAETGDPGLD